MSPPVGILLSGGLDSSILLARLLGESREVQPLYVRSGLAWEAEEQAAIDRFLGKLETTLARPLVVLDQPVADLYGGHWSLATEAAPGAGSPDEAVYLPGRNALLLLKPLLWCAAHGIEELALGVLASNPFADASDRFLDAFAGCLGAAVGRSVRVTCPLIPWTKRQVMEFGRDLPLEATFSCIAPVEGRHCGRCNKCAERAAAFRAAGLGDPTDYAAGMTGGKGSSEENCPGEPRRVLRIT